MKIFSFKKPRYNEEIGKWELEAIYNLNEHSKIELFDTEEELQTHIFKKMDDIQKGLGDVRGEMTNYV